MEKYGKLFLNYPCYPYLSGALPLSVYSLSAMVLMRLLFRKILKKWDNINHVIFVKNVTVWIYNEVMLSKHATEIANISDPEHTAPVIAVYKQSDLGWMDGLGFLCPFQE